MRELAHSVSIGMRLVLGDGIALRRLVVYGHGHGDLLAGVMLDFNPTMVCVVSMVSWYRSQKRRCLPSKLTREIDCTKLILTVDFQIDLNRFQRKLRKIKLT